MPVDELLSGYLTYPSKFDFLMLVDTKEFSETSEVTVLFAEVSLLSQIWEQEAIIESEKFAKKYGTEFVKFPLPTKVSRRAFNNAIQQIQGISNGKQEAASWQSEKSG